MHVCVCVGVGVGAFVHLYTKNKAFTSNPVPGEVYTDDDNTTNNGQFMIVQGSLVDKSNEPKFKG